MASCIQCMLVLICLDWNNLAFASPISNLSTLGTIKVASILTTPYWTRITDKTTGEVNDIGFIPDLLDKLAEELQFDYELIPASNNQYGSKVGEEWRGAIGDVTNGSVHFAAGPITVTYERSKSVDFSIPFKTVDPVIVMRRPESDRDVIPIRLYAIFAPLSSSVWFLTILAYFVTSSVLYVISYFNPYEWRRMSHDGEATLREGESFTCTNSFWFAIGSFALQGFVRTPRSIGGRISVTFWWFFALVFVACYISSLTNYLKDGPQPDEVTAYAKITSYYDLSKSSTTKIILLRNTATEQYFKYSKVGSHSGVFSKFLQTGVYVDNYQQAFEKLKESFPGKYAVIAESPIASYMTNTGDCLLYMINDASVATRHYSLVFPRDSSARQLFDQAIAKLIDSGDLEKLIDRWFVSQCTRSVLERNEFQKYKPPTFSPVDMGRFSGAMFILAMGLVFAGIITVIEYLIYKYAETESDTETRGSRPPSRPTSALGGNSAPGQRQNLLTPGDNVNQKEITAV